MEIVYAQGSKSAFLALFSLVPWSEFGHSLRKRNWNQQQQQQPQQTATDTTKRAGENCPQSAFIICIHIFLQPLSFDRFAFNFTWPIAVPVSLTVSQRTRKRSHCSYSQLSSQSACLSVFLAACLSLCLSILLSVCQSVCLSFCQCFSLSFCLLVCRPDCLSVYQSPSLSVSQFVYQSVCLSLGLRYISDVLQFVSTFIFHLFPSLTFNIHSLARSEYDNSVLLCPSLSSSVFIAVFIVMQGILSDTLLCGACTHHFHFGGALLENT